MGASMAGDFGVVHTDCTLESPALSACQQGPSRRGGSMDYRGVLLVGLLSGAAIASATTSCSGPDPGLIVFSERPKTTEQTSGGNPVPTEGGLPTDSGTTDSGGGDAG